MEHVGPENVVQVCTNNAANYVLARKQLMEKNDKVFLTPCVIYYFDLMLEDIKQYEKFKKVIIMERKITSFIYLHIHLHDAFTTKSNGKELIQYGVIRFVTSLLTLQNLHDIKGILKKIFVSNMWIESS